MWLLMDAGIKVNISKRAPGRATENIPFNLSIVYPAKYIQTFSVLLFLSLFDTFQWTHDVTITASLHQNGIVTSFWPDNGVIITSCVCLACFTQIEFIGVTVYPKTYAHGFCFAVLCCGYTLTDFPISIRLTSLALWQSKDCPSASKATLMNMDKYFMWIHYERLHNHNQAKHNKTVCIFLGIYCTSPAMAYCRNAGASTLKLIG